MAGLHLGGEIEAGGPGEMAGSRFEGAEGEPLAGAQRHQPVIGRVVLDLVQPLANSIIGMEDRSVLIGKPREMLGLARVSNR